MKLWFTCTAGCGEEFRVISESLEPVTYCPLCGEDLEYDEDEEDVEWDE
jgi:rRNA maturation endonuclease Nob1